MEIYWFLEVHVGKEGKGCVARFIIGGRVSVQYFLHSAFFRVFVEALETSCIGGVECLAAVVQWGGGGRV